MDVNVSLGLKEALYAKGLWLDRYAINDQDVTFIVVVSSTALTDSV